MFPPVLYFFLYVSQVPRQISVTTVQHHSWIPVEIAGWLLRRFTLPETPEVLVYSASADLPIALCVRGPLPLNVTWGRRLHPL